MIKRSRFVVAFAIILVLAVSACGDGDETEDIAPLSVATAETVEPVLVSTVEVLPPTPLRPQPTSEPTVTPASEPTVGPAPTETPEPTVAPTATQAPEPTVAPTPTQVPEPTPTALTRLSGDESPAAEEVSLAPGAEELSTVEVVKILTPSIVQILTDRVGMGMFNQPVPSTGVGTGVIIDTRGNILTNNHVIAGAETISVTLSNGESFRAEVVGADSSTDTAVVRISAPGLRPAKLGNSSELQVGEDVVAIGHALGLQGGPTVSKGVVSALGRALPTDQQNTIVDLIQTDASINPGNSGGALVNTRAEVIGINTAIIPGSQSIGFAINIDDVKLVAAQLMDTGSVERGFLGIAPLNLVPGIANQIGVPVTEGIVVVNVVRDSGAENAGLRPEDVIVQLGDEPIANTGELSKFLMAHPAGDTVDLIYFRRETRVSTKITLGARP